MFPAGSGRFVERHAPRHESIMSHIAHRGTSLVFAGLLAAAGCSKPQPAPAVPEVTVAKAVDQQVTDWDEFTGRFEAVQSVEVRPRVSGFVQHIAFPEGAFVKQGDVLLTIDPRPYEAEVSKADAEVEQARTREQLAQQELERAKRLVSTQAISREEFDARASAVAEAGGAVRAAEAAQRNAKLNLDWATVRAPISGRVGRAEITAGNLVQGGSQGGSLLTTIVSLDPIYVYFDSDEQAYLKYIATNRQAAQQRSVQVGL